MEGCICAPCFCQLKNMSGSKQATFMNSHVMDRICLLSVMHWLTVCLVTKILTILVRGKEEELSWSSLICRNVQKREQIQEL